MKKGFTLIELLVVIVILALLSMIGLASFAKTQKRARDTKRRGDLKAIQNAFEQYYEDNNYNYPANASGVAPYFSGGSWPVGPKGENYTTGFVFSTSNYSKSIVLELGPTISISNLQ